MADEGSIQHLRDMFFRTFFEDTVYNQDENGDTQLHIFIAHGEQYENRVLEIIKFTEDVFQLNLINNDGYSLLHIATAARSWRVIQRLIKKGVNPCLRNNEGNTALHLACKYNYMECVGALTYRELPENTVDHTVVFKFPKLKELEIFNHEGQTCLHIAVINNNMHLVHHLLLYGANIEAPTRNSGYTALHIAAQWNFSDIAVLLLKKWKAKVNALSYNSKTALDLALYHRKYRMAALLEKFGGQRSHFDSDGDSSSSDTS